MKVGIYDRWLTALGGGERMVLALAEALAADHAVEVIVHQAVDLDRAAAKLNVDTRCVRLRCVPELPDDDQLAPLTSAYDLFIAASQATFIPARARHNWMLVFFPYPIALSPLAHFRRRVGLWLRQLLMVPVYAAGFYGAERDGNQMNRWTDGHAMLKIPLASGQVPLRLLIDSPAETRLSVQLNGQPIQALDLLPGASNMPIEIMARSNRDGVATIELISAAHDQLIGSRDSRSAGVALRGIEIDHWRYRLYQQLFERHFKHWGLRLLNVPSDRGAEALGSYSTLLAISRFTQDWIRRYWSRDSELLYPPVEVEAFQPGEKRNIILTVGRIFAGGHNKKHLPMISAFKQLIDNGLRGWEFHIAGSVGQEAVDRDYFQTVQAAAQDYPIVVHRNIEQAELRALYAAAKIYWHASGYGENEQRDPIKFEHFGITTVEAMAAGAVPIVIGRAGQREIVEPDRSGLQWQTLDELLAQTRAVIANEALWQRLSVGAQERSRAFGRAAFENRVQALMSTLGSVG
jgi:glycosyltransferase involved in cell wall biosynthesis